MDNDDRPGDTGRGARRQARRAELLEAAMQAIRREGATVSMEGIAAEAGVTKPILYKHFGDRGGLAQALAERFVADLFSDLGPALHQEATHRRLLEATIDAYLAFVEREPQLYRFLTQEAHTEHPGMSATIQGLMAQVGQQVALVLGARLRAEGRDPEPAEAWAFGIVGMVHLAGDWWLERRTLPRESLVAHLSTLLWDGFAGMAPADPAPADIDITDGRAADPAVFSR